MITDTSTTTNIPTIEQWQNYTGSELASYVQARKVSLMLSVDGTQRFYLTHRLHSEDDKPFQFEEYVEFVITPMAKLYELVFSLGVNTVLTTVLLPSNFDRAGKYAAKVIEQTYHAFGGPLFQSIYHRYKVDVGLFGDYDIAPAADSVRSQIEQLKTTLAALSRFDTITDGTTTTTSSSSTASPQNDNHLLLGFCAGSSIQEIVKRSEKLRTNGVEPTDEALRKACFPQGPERLDILIEAGWLKAGGLVPPLLDGGHTNTYDLAFLMLDLDEVTLRRILYDHIFLREAWSDDKQSYSLSDIKVMREYYQANQGRLIGLGHLVDPGLWYPHTPTSDI